MQLSCPALQSESSYEYKIPNLEERSYTRGRNVKNFVSIISSYLLAEFDEVEEDDVLPADLDGFMKRIPRLRLEHLVQKGSI